ncbi:PD-(D/E)XK nuclease family protein [Sulfurimonas sp.]|uniref:PD-(D/E)XK nuclease family protein n=1 Tax=Sulfurimonas sp. TaxID=2022749 RepID=UPI0025FAE170|nr:PD-(D/E)XK nuclease family protein [Sulfurimonas sp.]MDD5157578.1 PD-(D/E)XK nuclease family protein [Sulfurimonas sp.]
MNKTIVVLPSARAIRHKQLEISGKTIFLPDFIMMGDFISRLCVVEGFRALDSDSRVLLLLEASDFKAFSNLQIERNFFTFTKNSSYIFNFFEELSAELYDIKKLITTDIYGEYEEHIAILIELYKRYKQLCEDKKLLDKIFLPSLYKFNQEYIKQHKEIELHLDGHLTNFEFELLEKCCEFSSVTIIFSATKFNKKMQSKFLELGIELEPYFEYKISLNEKKVLSFKKIIKNRNVVCESFSEPILQIAYIQKKVQEFVQKGYLPENIAVIVPDEKIIELIESFDQKSNFNFAMGEQFSRTKIYEKISATTKFIEQKSKENEARLRRVGDEFYTELQSIYYESCRKIDILEFLKRYKESFADKVSMAIVEEELFRFKNILPYMKDMNIKSVLSLFLQRLSGRTLDDVRGGKITVMGVLETRLVLFDAVVIVDFSDSNVPKRSDRDMFLNTALRERASLPTMSDRENLQKHYYEMLINRSKEVAISFVKSTQSSGSRFLKQLGIKEQSSKNESEYAKMLFSQKEPLVYEEQDIVMEYSFKDKKLSATKLKTYLTCKRKFYYKYVKQVASHNIPKDMPQEYEIGLSVHDALKRLYLQKSSYESADELKRDLYRELDAVCGESELESYQIALQKRVLESFCEAEIRRFAEGWQVEFCEKRVECDFMGITLEGQIDRIDTRGNEIFVLDYKTGSYPLYNEKNFTEATDFQLEFYYLLANGFGDVTGCGYYDLKESKIVNEVFLREKLELLKSHVSDLLNIEDVNFSKCEDVKNCIFCEYAIMCRRK